MSLLGQAISVVAEAPPEALPAALLHEVRQRMGANPGELMAMLEERAAESLGLSAHQFIQRLGVSLHYRVLNMEDLYRLAPAFDLLSFPESLHRNCLLARDDDRIICVLGDPFDLAQQTWLESRSAQAMEWCLAHKNDLAAFFAVHEDSLRAIDGSFHGNGAVSDQGQLTIEDLSLSSIAEDSSPVVRLVNSTIYDALKLGASDIHLEATPSGLQVKYRIDGVLAHIASVPGMDTVEQVVSRIKVMAELDIAERRIPQDGRFKLSIKGQEIDYRVSVMPSIVAEDVVIRILDKRSLADQITGLRLDLLGFSPDTLAEIRALAAKPYGMLLVTGPTGSGKTTTMYAALSEINNGQDKIITIEDPVEYQLPGVLQIPVNEKKGLNFARGLRSILRHDPDKILVGEIRDPETAQIAIQSALTGHLVLTSVHANNVFDVLGRFLHMGVDTYSFVSALNGIMAQRLLRLNCPECSIPYQPSLEELKSSGISAEDAAGMNFHRGRGCGHCRGTGYKGRHAIGEVLHLNDELRELIIARATIRKIKDAARANGTRFLREAALDLMAAGRTTLDEINRVTFVS
ncbi:GspE/PulE family protein [Herbaspirillum sp. C9C3]|uniref:GspE/PulE family protein n=1 Tax=Herbaspirillum sp. C9C3 TaxID=2735271 RepID=UPI0015855DF7|nr:GspE/PulE family protein [Herbaspirillum sp. C9C3]NUT60843.1 type II/IV secretion system protein [Herbaspirillum sp. C9C3]